MQASVLQHVAFEDIGTFAGPLAQWNAIVTTYQAGVDDLAEVDRHHTDLLIVLGGPIGVYDAALYPFLTDELRLIERRLAQGRPLLGVCLGAQLIAAAAGARVYPSPAKEIGFAPLALTADGAASCLGHLADAANTVLHWHGDTFDLPQGALRLASTPLTENQAFSLGPNVLGLQFHMEADARMLERWLIGHTGEIASAGLDVRELRKEGVRFGGAVSTAGARAFSAWLDGVMGERVV